MDDPFCLLCIEQAGDVRSFNGKADIETVSIAFGPGLSWGQVCLGNAGCAYGFSEQIGLDMSDDIFIGYGTVYDIREGAPCCDY